MNNNLVPIEFSNQRILTTEQLADIYKTPIDNIKVNYNNHKDKFEKGKHYFFLEGADLKAFKNCVNDIYPVNKHTRNLYLWTVRGASRHCKILDTDEAWEQFDLLEESYFNSKEKGTDISLLSPDLQMFKKLLDCVANTQLEQLKLQNKVSYVEKTLTVVKDTIIQCDDDWRKSLNKMFNNAVGASGTKDFQFLRKETYDILEERAKCDLNTRLRNLHNRLVSQGATKSKIKNTTKLDIIESDPKLKEIYTSIVKELSIKYTRIEAM